MQTIRFTVFGEAKTAVHNKRVSDDAILLAYRSHRSIDKVAGVVGLTRTSVHERLVRLGVKCNGHGEPWAPDDLARLRREYALFRSSGKLKELAASLARPYGSVTQTAHELGLTTNGYERLWQGNWKYMTEPAARVLLERLKSSRLGIGQFCRRHRFGEESFSNTMRRFFADEWDHVVELKSPRQTLYRLGRQVEYAVRDDLKRRGYPVVLRSPRSGGPVDVLALKSGAQLLVQAKRSLQLGIEEWNALFQLAASVGAIPVLAGRPTGRGLIYMRLDGEKNRSRRAQPMTRFEP